jgi:DNA-binding Lrp family transcriptional regulator
MKKEGKNRPVISLVDYLILKCLSLENNLLNNSISKKINISLSKTGERLDHLEEIGLIKRIKADKGPGIINFIEQKNKKKIEDFLKILNENSI